MTSMPRSFVQRLLLSLTVLVAAGAFALPTELRASELRNNASCGASCSISCCEVSGIFCNCWCDEQGRGHCDCMFEY